MTTYTQTGNGGVRANGHSKYERITYRVPDERRTGISRCLQGSPFFPVPTEESKLLRPKYWMDQPVLKTNPRQETNGIWCQVEEGCQEGVLPRVIQRRLKGHISDSKGTISPRDRGIATATGI